jgi:hypothetical protein
MSKQTQQEKLELIERDLQERADTIESNWQLLQLKEEEVLKSVNTRLHIIRKEDLLLTITKTLTEIFSLYESTMGTVDGCQELINNVINAKTQIDNIDTSKIELINLDNVKSSLIKK